MELQIAFSATTSILVTATTVLLLTLLKHYNRSNAQNLPPGPWKLPIIGSMHHLATGSLLHHALKKLSLKHGPLMHLKLGEISDVVVSSPQMAKLIMKTHDVSFGARPGTFASDVFTYNKCDIAFAPCNDHWRQMRKICVVELLNKKRVKSFSPVREDEVSSLVDSIRKSTGSAINLRDQLSTLTSSVTCRAAFSDKFLGQSSLISVVNEATSLMGGFNLNDFFPSLKFLSLVTGMKSKVLKIHEKIDMIMDDIIKKRRENNGVGKSGNLGKEKEDLLDVLLRLQQENLQEFSLSDDVIKAMLFETFGAGTETSATTVECAMSKMMKDPKILEKAQSEVRRSLGKMNSVKDFTDTQGLHYLQMVIKETLRLNPPVPLILTECTEAFDINKLSIPVKTMVIVNSWAIGRDPEFWEDAEKFIPERFEDKNIEYNGNDFKYIPFGAGRRICPGISFALATIELVLAQLLYHFNWRLPDGVKPEELDMAGTKGMTMQKKNPLYLIADINEETLIGS